MRDAINALAHRVAVAVVSGRTVEDLQRFGFPEHVEVFGLHGMERDGERGVELAAQEQERLERLVAMAAAAAEQAGDGAWVEVKPASVVLHVREAPPDDAARSAATLRERAEDVTGVHVLPGHGVVELLTRATSKARAVDELREEIDAAAVVFLGDDRTDEEVFAALGDGDCSIRVGPGDTLARHRLAGPPDVLRFLQTLTALV
jgi:trehalose-phosphatase